MRVHGSMPVQSPSGLDLIWSGTASGDYSTVRSSAREWLDLVM
jgi:hypothetical protein